MLYKSGFTNPSVRSDWTGSNASAIASNEFFGVEEDSGLSMKVYLGGQWVIKPVRVYLDGQWVVKPLKAYVSGQFK